MIEIDGETFFSGADGGFQAPSYSMSFGCRETVWRCNIFNHGGADSNSFEICDLIKGNGGGAVEAIRFRLVSGVQSSLWAAFDFV